MSIYSRAPECIWRFTYIYSNNLTFDKILIQLVNLPLWRHSSLPPVELTVSTSSHIKENVESSLFLLESLLHTRTPASGEMISHRPPPLLLVFLLGGPGKTSTQIRSLSTRENVFNVSISKNTRSRWSLALRHWTDSLRKCEFLWNLLPGCKHPRGFAHWGLSLLLGKLSGIYQLSHLRNKETRITEKGNTKWPKGWKSSWLYQNQRVKKLNSVTFLLPSPKRDVELHANSYC